MVGPSLRRCLTGQDVMLQSVSAPISTKPFWIFRRRQVSHGVDPLSPDPKFFEAVKGCARGLFEALLDDEPRDGYTYVSTLTGLEMCGVETSEGVVWAVKIHDNGSPVGLKIRAGYKVASIRNSQLHHINMNDKSSSSLCVTQLPSGQMKLTTLKDLLDL